MKIQNDARIKTAANGTYKKTEDIPDFPRKTEVAKFRLSTGHDSLAKHLHRINILLSPICNLCSYFCEEMDKQHLAVMYSGLRSIDLGSQVLEMKASMSNAAH